MELQTSFGVLSEVIERYESRGGSIRSVEATTDDGGTLRSSLEVPMSTLPGDGGAALAPERAGLTDGGLRVEFSLPDDLLPGGTEPAATASEQGVRVDGGSVLLAVELVIDAAAVDGDPAESEASTDTSGEQATDGGDPGEPVSDGGSSERPRATTDTTPESAEATTDAAPAEESEDAVAAGESEDAVAAVRDDSVPPYDDTAYLAELYEACETFAEMSRRIEMDVSAETVRRYMIDAGVHDPTSYDTVEEDRSPADEAEPSAAPSAEEAESAPTATRETEQATAGRSTGEMSDDAVRELADEQPVTDGLDLDPELDVEEIVDAVVESHTMYEVTRRLGTDPERTRELLRQLNLIDLVLCRANDERADEVTPKRVAARIRQCAPGGA